MAMGLWKGYSNQPLRVQCFSQCRQRCFYRIKVLFHLELYKEKQTISLCALDPESMQNKIKQLTQSFL